MGGTRWTPDEEAVLLAYPDMDAKKMAEILKRPWMSITARRAEMRKKGTLRRKQVVTAIGSRILIAKTCNQCGLFLPGAWFRKSNGQWSGICKDCVNEYQKEWSKNRVHRADHSRKLLNELTTKLAIHHREFYSPGEDATIIDTSKSSLQKALELGRTLYSVENREARLKVVTRENKWGDPGSAVWVIRFAHGVPDRAKRQEFADAITQLGIVPESNWDWND